MQEAKDPSWHTQWAWERPSRASLLCIRCFANYPRTKRASTLSLLPTSLQHPLGSPAKSVTLPETRQDPHPLPTHSDPELGGRVPMWIPKRSERHPPSHTIYRIKGQCAWQQKLDDIAGWHKNGGNFLLGYQMYRQLLVKGEKALGKASYEPFARIVSLPGPSLLIADEGHVIKNVKGALAHIIKQTGTPLRICLTGYPLQNNLTEYWCMVDFCRPGFLGDLQRFRHAYVNPDQQWIPQGCFHGRTQVRRKETLYLDPPDRSLCVPHGPKDTLGYFALLK